MDATKTITHDWRDILRAFKMAFDPKKVLLGYFGLLASMAWCLVVISFFSSVKMISASPTFVISLVCRSLGEGVPFLARSVLSTLSPMDFGEFFVLVVLVVGLLVIWAMVGGAITRIAALDFARDESIRMVDAWRFARKKIVLLFLVSPGAAYWRLLSCPLQRNRGIIRKDTRPGRIVHSVSVSFCHCFRIFDGLYWCNRHPGNVLYVSHH